MTFLEEAALYFENRPTGGEDSAHWANTYNAENCRKADARLRAAADLIRAMLGDEPGDLDAWQQNATDWLNNEPPER